MACSAESTEGFCGLVPDGTWDCKASNVCRTCSTFSANGGKCVEIDHYPNATVAEFGSVSGADAMAKEIQARGPIACGIDAGPILNYTGGIADMPGAGIDHIVSIIGWGTDATTKQEYWKVRNSWGEFWGEMGYVRVAKGNNSLQLESSVDPLSLSLATRTLCRALSPSLSSLTCRAHPHTLELSKDSLSLSLHSSG
jgi:cathepsin X